MKTELIQNILLKETGVDVKEETRKRSNQDARKIFCKLCVEFTNQSYSDIGSFIGLKSHSAVFNALLKFDNLIKTDKIFRFDYMRCKKHLLKEFVAIE